MKRRVWSKIELTDIYTRRETVARVVDVKRMLIMAALTALVVASTACLLELRAVRARLAEVEERDAARAEAQRDLNWAVFQDCMQRWRANHPVEVDALGNKFLVQDEGGEP